MKPRKRRKVLPKVGHTGGGTGFGEDGRPTWQRLYGLGTSWNKRAFETFSNFAIFAVALVAALFLLLCLAAWLMN